MVRKIKRPDVLRIIALLVYFLIIIYLWLFIFMPKTIPSYLTVFIPSHKKNVLVMGVDYSYDTRHQVISSGRRTDTIILVQLNPLTNKINIVNIPRDSLANIPGYGMNKINFAFARGGEELAKQAVANLLDINVDDAVTINLQGVIKLVDSMGGIKIYVEKDMYYKDSWGHLNINLKKGMQKLSGEQVQGYIRFRHDALGDIGRVDRQKKFIKTLFGKLASPLTLVRLPLVIPALKETVKTDLSFLEILKIANFARMIKPSEIGIYTLPGNFSSEKELFGYWITDPQRIRQLKDQLKL